jgi:hypothetical protein
VGIVSVNGTEDRGFGSRQGKRFFWTAYKHVSAVHCNLIHIVVVVYAFERFFYFVSSCKCADKKHPKVDF